VIDSHDQAEKIYKQILDQLEEIWLLYADAEEEEENPDEGTDENDRDIVEAMVEDGTERGMDEESVEKVFKAISGLAKKAQDA
jgi:DNA-binding transcriptional regulator YhcF (GntR family)